MKNIILLILFVAIVVGVGFYFLNKDKKPTASAEEDSGVKIDFGIA